MDESFKKQKGFLLIEILIYVFLFSVIIFGSFQTFFSLADNSRSLSDENLALEEAEFIIKKIKNSIASSKSIIKPSSGETSDELLLEMEDPKDDPVVFKIEDGSLVLKRGQGNYTALNNSRLTVSHLSFERVTLENTDKYWAVDISFKINGRDFNSFEIKYEGS